MRNGGTLTGLQLGFVVSILHFFGFSYTTFLLHFFGGCEILVRL